jgi:hypothetical protein
MKTAFHHMFRLTKTYWLENCLADTRKQNRISSKRNTKKERGYVIA